MTEEIRREEVEILNEIYKRENVTQRALAKELNLSLGMVNLFINKLAEKGLIKIKKLKNKQMLKYVLTPYGFNERLRYNYNILKGSIDYFMSVRDIILHKLNEIQVNSREIYIYGTDLWAEMIFLGVKNYGFNFIGFIKDEEEINEKLGYKVFSFQEIIEKKNKGSNYLIIANSVLLKSYIAENIREMDKEGIIVWL
ncbi:MAG: winged helix-turn-helix domain-containing protein [Candidatus Hydrogenedentota bacterium]